MPWRQWHQSKWRGTTAEWGNKMQINQTGCFGNFQPDLCIYIYLSQEPVFEMWITCSSYVWDLQGIYQCGVRNTRLVCFWDRYIQVWYLKQFPFCMISEAIKATSLCVPLLKLSNIPCLALQFGPRVLFGSETPGTELGHRTPSQRLQNNKQSPIYSVQKYPRL